MLTNLTISINANYLDGILTIDYRDNGVGLQNIDKSRIFEPFYTTSDKDEHKAIGMRIVYDVVVTMLKGELVPPDDEGYAIRIKLPVKAVLK